MEQIVYKEFLPDRALTPYIDAFWTVTGANTAPLPDKIMPDGCVDIILNSGPAFLTSDVATPMARGEAYLIGTMTHFKEMVRPPATQLTGIRFKPGGFAFFYDHSLLRDTANRTIEFDRSLIPAIDISIADPLPVWNSFFLRRLRAPVQPIQPLIAYIQRMNGRVTVSQLARQNFIPARRLERLFGQHLAISPKEFINFARYQTAIQQIKVRPANKTLLDIACDCGYYDHAHLSNEVKKYTGSVASAF